MGTSRHRRRFTLGLFELEGRVTPAFYSLKPGVSGGLWLDPSIWDISPEPSDPSTATGPGPLDDVSIEPAGTGASLSVTLGLVGGVQVHSLDLGTEVIRSGNVSTLTLQGGTLRTTAGWTARDFTVALKNASVVVGTGDAGSSGQAVVTYGSDINLALENVTLPDTDVFFRGYSATDSNENGGLKNAVYGLTARDLAVDPGASSPVLHGFTVRNLTVGAGANAGTDYHSTDQMTVSGALTVNGEFNAGNLTAGAVANYGTLGVSAAVAVGGDFFNAGTLLIEYRSDQTSPLVGITTVSTGSFENTATGVVQVRESALIPAPAAPFFHVTGEASLGGTIEVENLDLTQLRADALPFMSYDSLAGRFTDLRDARSSLEDPFQSGLSDSYASAPGFVGLDYNPSVLNLSLLTFPLLADTAGQEATVSSAQPASSADGRGLVIAFNGGKGEPFTGLVSPITASVDRTKWDVMDVDYSAVAYGFDVLSGPSRLTLAQSAYDYGQSLAYWMRNEGYAYSQFHVISYSMGTWAAAGFTDALGRLGLAGVDPTTGADNPAPIALTLLDAYVPVGQVFPGLDRRPEDDVGAAATWAEQYQDTRDSNLVIPNQSDDVDINYILPKAYNVIVNATDDGRVPDIENFPSGVNYLLNGHAYVPSWYLYTITHPLPPAVPDWWGGWGYAKSPEFAGATPTFANYPRGQSVVLTPTPTPTPTPLPTPSPPTSPPGTTPPGTTPTPTVPAKQLPAPGTVAALTKVTAVGTGAGAAGAVYVYDAGGNVMASYMPFGAAFTGGVRVASADFNGDGTPDVVAATGPGAGNRVVILDGKSQQPLADFSPYESAFAGGLFVSVGDVTGDGVPDLIASPDDSGGPVVTVYDGASLGRGQVAELARFFGISDPNFRGGARTAVGDLNGDGTGDLIVSAGFGGGPRVAIYDGRSVASAAPTELVPDFFAFESTLRNGAYVAAGDLTGAGTADVIFGAGPGGAPRVRAIAGGRLLAAAGDFQSLDDAPATSAGLADFFAGDPGNRAGVQLSVADLDGDSQVDLTTGSGQGGGATVSTYTGAAITADPGSPAASRQIDVLPGFDGGVYVG